MTEVLAALADLPIAQLAMRMASVAVFIVLVALISERVGPFLGAMAASLPIYTGPVYLFLALDHPPDFLARVATASVAAFAVTPIYLLIYGLFARAVQDPGLCGASDGRCTYHIFTPSEPPGCGCNPHRPSVIVWGYGSQREQFPLPRTELAEDTFYVHSASEDLVLRLYACRGGDVPSP